MSRSDVLRKIAALLRLAERGGTTEESMAAAGKAQELMDRYQIDRATAELDGKPSEPDEPIESFYGRPDGHLDQSKRIDPWRMSLAGALARSNGCFIFTSTKVAGRTIEIVGRPSNVETVRYMYGWFVNEVNRLVDRDGRGLGAVWRREDREGAVQELGARLKAARQDAVAAAVSDAKSGTALVLVRAAVAQVERQTQDARELGYRLHGLVSRRGGSGNRQYNGSAREAGREAARSVNIGGSRNGVGAGMRQIGGQ